MPIVKKQNADFRADTQVSVADPAAGDSASPQVDGQACDRDGSQVEVIRAANGDITQINVRCDCGRVTSVACEY